MKFEEWLALFCFVWTWVTPDNIAYVMTQPIHHGLFWLVSFSIYVCIESWLLKSKCDMKLDSNSDSSFQNRLYSSDIELIHSNIIPSLRMAKHEKANPIELYGFPVGLTFLSGYSFSQKFLDSSEDTELIIKDSSTYPYVLPIQLVV